MVLYEIFLVTYITFSKNKKNVIISLLNASCSFVQNRLLFKGSVDWIYLEKDEIIG